MQGKIKTKNNSVKHSNELNGINIVRKVLVNNQSNHDHTVTNVPRMIKYGLGIKFYIKLHQSFESKKTED